MVRITGYSFPYLGQTHLVVVFVIKIRSWASSPGVKIFKLFIKMPFPLVRKYVTWEAMTIYR